jgi:3-oxoacyl-[acyl-carrier protein] reductase
LDKKQFQGKNALVTGSSSGIGRAVAENLGTRGANVVVNFPFDREEANAGQVVDTINQAGGRAIAVKADMTRLPDITRIFDEAEAAFGKLNFVVSNVGGNLSRKTIDEVTEEDYDAGTTLNAKSQFFVLQQAGRRVCDGGRIVALSSSSTTLAYSGIAVYCGAKAAVELYVRVLAREVGARGITVNTVAPGLTLTPGSSAPAERRDWVKSITPLARLGVGQDVGDAVTMLLGDDAHWITAQHIKAGGGAFS